jgi:two-component system, chemotaxis family, protein-glutamate methylesterase/glutaminase
VSLVDRTHPRDTEAVRRFDAVALVASLGGLGSLTTVLGALPSGFTARVLIAQHGRRGKPERLARVLAHHSTLPVRVADHGGVLPDRGVVVVPTGYAATVGDRWRVSLTEDDALRGGDALLTSLAGVAGRRMIGVVLTGMLHDGAHGVRVVKKHGGRVIAQDPATARGTSMPSSAIATGCVDHVLPPERIGPALVALTMAPGGAELLAVPTPSWARFT